MGKCRLSFNELTLLWSLHGYVGSKSCNHCDSDNGIYFCSSKVCLFCKSCNKNISDEKLCHSKYDEHIHYNIGRFEDGT
jgi:hypothetical protein